MVPIAYPSQEEMEQQLAVSLPMTDFPKGKFIVFRIPRRNKVRKTRLFVGEIYEEYDQRTGLLAAS